MILFKVKKRKVWHIENGYGGSYCRNASTHDPVIRRGLHTKSDYEEFRSKQGLTWEEYKSQPDVDYADLLEVDEVPHSVHDSLCKGCLSGAFEEEVIRIVGR